MTGATHLVFSLGPVQGFIAQSRRTADGWVGSYLISYIMGSVLLYAEREGLTVQEPDTAHLPMLDAMRGKTAAGDLTVAAIPNVAVLRLGGKEPAEIARVLEQEARRVWIEDIVREVEARVFPELREAKPIWDAQAATCWEISIGWGAGSAAAYRSLAARKGVRDFVQSESRGDRCTVCADREALWPGNGSPVREAARKAWAKWSGDLTRDDMPGTLFSPGGRERLCAPCLIRRLLPWIDNPLRRLWTTGHGTGAFPSTSTVATVHYRAELLESAMTQEGTALKARLSEYANGVRKAKGRSERRLDARVNEPGAFPAWRSLQQRRNAWPELLDLLAVDGDAWLYGEAVRGEHEFGDETHWHLSSSYRDVLNSASSLGLGGPPIYYALLAMDGDKLGDFKEKVEKRGGETGPISACLTEFAHAVPGIVEAHNGRVIFAGGDDVLALLPLVDALPAAETLRKHFAEAFGKASAKAPWPVDPPTLSGGIVYAHHQAPLGRVMAAAQSLLKQWAKTKADRNAIACQKFQRNGPAWTCAAQWVLPNGGAFVPKLLEAVARLKERDVAKGLAHTLEQYAWVLDKGGFLEPNHRRQFAAAILEKSRLLSQKPDERRPAALAISDDVLALCDAARGGPPGQLDTSLLLLARFLSAEGREER